MKLGISGTHSAGKTTLLSALRSEKIFKDYEVCDEVTRTVKTLGLPINENGTDSTQRLIMNQHIVNLFLHDKMLTDRTSLDGYVYSLWLYNNNKISTATLEYAESVFASTINLYDHIVFIKPEFDVVNDGVRSTDSQFRDEIHNYFTDVIARYNIKVKNVTGSVRERVEQILEVI